MNNNFKSSWDNYINNTLSKNVVLLSFIGIIFVLVFIPVDYFISNELFFSFLFVRLFGCTYVLLLLYLFKKQLLKLSVFIYLGFTIPCLLISYFCSFLSGDSLFIYNVNYSACFILFFFLLGWGWKHTLIIATIFNIFYALFFCINHKDISELFSTGFIILWLSSFISSIVCGVRFQLMKKEYALRFKLQKLVLRLKNKGSIIENKNKELSLFKDVIENSSDAIIILTVNAKQFTIDKIIYQNLNFSKLNLHFNPSNKSDYLGLFNFKDAGSEGAGLKYLLESSYSKFENTQEVDLRSKDGFNIIAEISFLTLDSLTPGNKLVIAFIRDVTVKKNIEEKKIKQNLRNYLITINSVNMAQEKERERFAKDLHDGLGQVLTSIKLNLVYLNEIIDPNQKPFVLKCVEDISYSISEMRNISYGIAPPSLIQFGLISAITEICKKSNLANGSQINFYSNIRESKTIFNKTDDINIYRLIQEAINNILKHSHASFAEICLYKIEKKILIIIRDNGIGLKQNVQNYSVGINSIKTRSEIIGAKINVFSNLGTEILIMINKRINKSINNDNQENNNSR